MATVSSLLADINRAQINSSVDAMFLAYHQSINTTSFTRRGWRKPRGKELFARVRAQQDIEYIEDGIDLFTVRGRTKGFTGSTA